MIQNTERVRLEFLFWTFTRMALVVVAPLHLLPPMCSPDWAGGQPRPGRPNLIPNG
jgi:hypothetical protein